MSFSLRYSCCIVCDQPFRNCVILGQSSMGMRRYYQASLAHDTCDCSMQWRRPSVGPTLPPLARVCEPAMGKVIFDPTAALQGSGNLLPRKTVTSVSTLPANSEGILCFVAKVMCLLSVISGIHAAAGGQWVKLVFVLRRVHSECPHLKH
jgi:hypothetical protein